LLQQVWLSFIHYREGQPPLEIDGCITVFDGNDTTASQLMRWCGHSLPRDITSSGNVVFVTFRNDVSTLHDSDISIGYRGIIAVDGKTHRLIHTYIKFRTVFRRRTVPQSKAFGLQGDTSGWNVDVRLMSYL